MNEAIKMKKYHDVKNLRFDGDLLITTIDGQKKTFSINDVSPVLGKASERERCVFEISPSGYGIRWPLLDEDISIDGMLGIVHFPSQEERYH